MPNLLTLLRRGNRIREDDKHTIGRLAERIGNAEYGQGVFLTGSEQIIPVETGDIQWDSFEPVTVSTTAVGLTESFAVGNTHAFITVAGAAVRYRADNAAPTATVGHELLVGDVLKLSNARAIDQVQFISRDGGSATLSVSYGRRA